MTCPNWVELADDVRATYTNLFRKLPATLADSQLLFLNAVDAEVEVALQHPQLGRLDHLAGVLLAQAGTSSMATLNTLLELYRVLKLESLDRLLEPERSATRVKRALFRELWHLARREVQAQLGREVKAVDQVLYEHGQVTASLYHGWCDGSFRAGHGYAGFLLRDANARLIAEASARIESASSNDCEVQALQLLLGAALGLGVQSLHVHVDSAGLGTFAVGRAPLRFAVQESLIQRLLSQFEHVKLIKVPRLYNHEADALSRALKD
jgi:hypothetical protein